jgi:polygalacturonase
MEQSNRKKERKMGKIALFSLPILVALAVLGWLAWYAFSPASAASTVCNVKSYGATGDGMTKDTAAIQKAIDTCASSGGGTVEFPAGKFLTAPLFLKSNITLQVDAGATILGSSTMSDYTVQSGEVAATSTLALINADQVNNIGITGSGVIDGQGSVWWSSGIAAESRPRLVMLAYINGIKVTGVTLQNAGAMHLFFSYSNNVTIDHINIYSPSNSPNTDGIDPAGSHHVTISNSTIDDGDDNIAIKSGEVQPAYPNAGTSDVLIENCTFKHGHGVSIGSETNGGVQNVRVLNSTFNSTTNGIRIKSTRSVGGDISQIRYAGLTMANVAHPIIFTGYYPKIPADGDPAQPITATTPYYHDITVDGLTATGASSIGDIVGVTEKPLTNITLNNVVISGSTGIIVRNAAVISSGGTKITATSGSGFIIQSQASVTTQ